MEFPESFPFPPATLLKIAAASLSPLPSISLPNEVPKVFQTFLVMLPPPMLPPIEPLPKRLINLLLPPKLKLTIKIDTILKNST
ncbi:MAG: hypothetical protein N2485_00005 [bacterium]|nr:hypothetical protein [bacterium]